MATGRTVPGVRLAGLVWSRFLLFLIIPGEEHGFPLLWPCSFGDLRQDRVQKVYTHHRDLLEHRK